MPSTRSTLFPSTPLLENEKTSPTSYSSAPSSTVSKVTLPILEKKAVYTSSSTPKKSDQKKNTEKKREKTLEGENEDPTPSSHICTPHLSRELFSVNGRGRLPTSQVSTFSTFASASASCCDSFSLSADAQKLKDKVFGKSFAVPKRRQNQTVTTEDIGSHDVLPAIEEEDEEETEGVGEEFRVICKFRFDSKFSSPLPLEETGIHPPLLQNSFFDNGGLNSEEDTKTAGKKKCLFSVIKSSVFSSSLNEEDFTSFGTVTSPASPEASPSPFSSPSSSTYKSKRTLFRTSPAKKEESDDEKSSEEEESGWSQYKGEEDRSEEEEGNGWLQEREDEEGSELEIVFLQKLEKTSLK